jgi:hypothetical protein
MSSPARVSYVRKHKIRLSIICSLVVIVLLILFWPITVYKTNYSTNIPPAMSNRSNPLYSIADSAIATNSTGDVSFSVQNFNYTSSDGTTKVSASSASIQITMTPIAQNDTKLDLNIQLSGLSIVSPSFTGKIGSADLSGFVLVNPATNQLVVSLVGTTSIAAIIQGIVGA